jgi:hypothetical protein
MSAFAALSLNRSVVMKQSLFALALLAGLSSGFAVAAYADDGSKNVGQQDAQLPVQQAPVGSTDLRDYRANVNPNSNIPTTGVYDQGDRFEGPTGRPLPGWGSANGEGAGDF